MYTDKAIAVLAVALSCAAGLPAATSTKAPVKKPAHTAAATASGTKKKGTVRRTRSKRRTPGKTSGRAAGSSWRAAQTVPTPERYKEIQTALAQKGYLHGEATGVWNQDSVDALRRFQQDQNLQASGKLDSLSIIALGLGPKHEAPAK